MVKTREQLVDACRKAGILVSIDAIWDARVPALVQYRCESPADLFDAFVAHPEAFPFPEELLILWSKNGDSITGFLSEQKIFIEYYLEDGPGEFEEIAKSYQELAGHVVGHTLGMKQPNQDAAQDLASFFNLQYFDEVRTFVDTSDEWEEGIPQFVRSIERNAP